MAENLKVAIIGAGTCSALLAAGLSKRNGVDFEIFESLTERDFQLPNADMMLGPSAVSALKAMGLDQEKLFRDASAKKWGASRCLVAVGEHKGEAILEFPSGCASVISTRFWHRELMKMLPDGKINYGKKLSAVLGGEGGEPCEVLFEDGSTFRADAIIGCDGLRSVVRVLILQDRYAHLIEPRFAGYWDVFGSTTIDKAAPLFGSDLFPFEDNEIVLTGDGVAMLFRPTGDPEKYDVFVSGVADDRKQIAHETFNGTFLQKIYKNWDAQFVDAITRCVLEDRSDNYPIFPQWESQEAPTYCHGRCCMIGDAAHNMPPWTGSNADMEVEDVAVLAALLASIHSREDVCTALMAFDQTRRGRSELIQRRTHIVAKIMTGQLGLDPGRIKPLQPEKWWEAKFSLDVVAHIHEALAHYESLRRPARQV